MMIRLNIKCTKPLKGIMYLCHVHILYKPYSASAIESIGDFNAWKEGDCTVEYKENIYKVKLRKK